jgi:hypothetical protein
MTENLKANIEIIIRHYGNDAKESMSNEQLIRYADTMYHLLQEVLKNEKA